MMELWGMRSTPSLPSLPGRLGPGMLAPERVLSIGQTELFDHLIGRKQMTDVYLNYYMAIFETI